MANQVELNARYAAHREAGDDPINARARLFEDPGSPGPLPVVTDDEADAAMRHYGDDPATDNE